jgi:Flp pilus assembly protein TadD
MSGMLFSRVILVCLATMIPLVLSFSLSADTLAPKQALWGILGGLLLAVPPLPRFRSEPVLSALLVLAVAMAVFAGTPLQALLPWVVGAAIYLRAGETGPGFQLKYARIAAAVAGLIALYALSQFAWNRFFTGIRLINPFGDRVPGTLGNPTFLSDYLAALLPVSLALMSLTPRTAFFYGWGTASLLSFAAILAGGSKGGQLAAVVGTAGWAFIFLGGMPRNRKLALLPAAAAIIVVALLATTPAALLKSVSRWTSPTERFSFTQRIDILKGAGCLITRSPLAGHGPGTFPVLFPEKTPAKLTKSLGLTLSVNHAHNDYAEVASDLGLAGLALLLFVLFRRVPSSLQPNLRGAFALSLVSLAVTMATNFALFLPSTALFIWLHAGFISSRGDAQPLRSPAPVRTLLGLAALGIGFLSIQTLLGNSYMRPGQLAVESGNGAQGEPFLEKGIRVSPGDRHIFQLLGRSFEMQGKLTEASWAYIRAWQMAPYLSITSFNVARVQREIYLRSRGRDLKALNFAIHALDLSSMRHPYFPEAREWGGELALNSGNLSAARRFLFEMPADFDSFTPGLHRLRARLLAREGKNGDARKELSAAQALENRQSLAEAESLMREGRIKEAEQLARKAVKADPGLGNGWELLGYILHTRGALPEARECYRRLEKIDPGSLAAQLNLILLSLSAGDRPGARKHLEKAGKISPDGEDVILAGARVLAFEGKTRESEAEYLRLLKLFPANSQARAELSALRSR